MMQLALFDPPPQRRRAAPMADEIYAKIIDLRRSGVCIRAEGLNLVVSGVRLTVREFRRLYDVGPVR